MGIRRLFMRVDPRDLERYTKKKVPRRRKRSPELIQRLDFLRRAMQALPPRELTMLYSLKVSRVEQDELKELYNVRQSNISYRLDRANYRIKLHKAIFEACSETALRSVLYDLGLPESAVRAVLGVVKTSSQSATASALGVTQGSVRHLYAMAIEKVENAPDSQPYKKEAYELLTLISSNYNHLRSIKIQCRWKWKVGDTNYPSKPKNSNDD